MMLAQNGDEARFRAHPIWRAAWLADSKRPEARTLGLLAKVNASEVAFEAWQAGGRSPRRRLDHVRASRREIPASASSFLQTRMHNQLCCCAPQKRFSAPAPCRGTAPVR